MHSHRSARWIADLEKRVGGFRYCSGIKRVSCLTSSGKQILPYVRKIVSDFEEIQQKVNEINGIQSGTVRIGTFSSVAINWLRMCLQGFRKIIRGLIMKCFWAIMRKWKNGSMRDV